MREERSPCFQCKHLHKSKSRCSGTCVRLDRYRERFPYLALWRDDETYYSIPGSERTPSYRACS